MAWHNELGRWGEDVAATYLECKGYHIVCRNWRVSHKEIDIIATDAHTLVFVEVKTRRTANYGEPYEAVDYRKTKNLMNAMRQYTATNMIDMPTRYDIVSVVGTPDNYTVEQIENAISNF